MNKNYSRRWKCFVYDVQDFWNDIAPVVNFALAAFAFYGFWFLVGFLQD